MFSLLVKEKLYINEVVLGTAFGKSTSREPHVIDAPLIPVTQV